MKALTWQGRRDVQVTDVPDPTIQEPTDAIIKVTSTAICGSDLHLYEVMGPFLTPGDVLGHETMGIVQEVGSRAAEHLAVGDRVVIPFGIACGSCWMCDRGLFAHCETTQNYDTGTGASLFGYTSLYGAVPGGQAEYLRVPQAHFGPVVLPKDGPDERFLFLSDVVPTAWQAVLYADVPEGGSLAVFGLGPIGQMCVRIAKHLGVETIIGIDLVSERLAAAAAWGATTIDISDGADPAEQIRALTAGRGADAAIDAVGMEAHGGPASTAAKLAQAAVNVLPDAAAQALTRNAGVDRLDALHAAITAVRRGGTVSISGVYGGAIDPMPLFDLFDKGIQLRMGQCHVHRYTQELADLASSAGDPLGLESFATHRLGLSEAPEAYKMFQEKSDGCLKVVLDPTR